MKPNQEYQALDGPLIEVTTAVGKLSLGRQKLFRDFGNRPLNRGWPFNRLPLSGGSTVLFLLLLLLLLLSLLL